MNTLDIMSGCTIYEELASYEQFETGYRVTVNEGKNVGGVSYISLRECKIKCDENSKCNSFTHCPGFQNACYLKDKKQTKFEATKSHSGCISYYHHKCNCMCCSINYLIFNSHYLDNIYALIKFISML